MAKVGAKGPNSAPVVQRVSPLKPGLRGARNWATAQVRAASYTRRGFWRLLVSVILLVAFTVFGSLWLGGFLPDARQVGDRFMRNSLISMGFVVDRVDVVGEGRLREEDVRTALGVDIGDFLFELDIEQAQKRVESLSWVELAVVRRLWPDRVVVQIIERRPYALWQHDGIVQLVDVTGEVISDADPLQFTGLPLVLGEGAEARVTDIQAILAPYPAIFSRVDVMTFQPTGRWDVRLNSGNTWIKLPKDGVKNALNVLEELHREQQILDRQIEIIDLRLPDRLTLYPRQSEPA